MKIKLDENLPASLAEMLTRLGHQTDTVPQEGLAGRQDSEIWQATQPGREALKSRIKHLFETENVEAWRRCFVVVTENKLRIRRP